jgi:ribosomal protein S18 acetylase RimI-like enzyme
LGAQSPILLLHGLRGPCTGDDCAVRAERIAGMASLVVVESALDQFVDDAAQIWAEATAKRDNDPEIAPLTLSRPVIDAVLGSSVRSRLLVAVDPTGQVVGFIAVEPSANDSDAAEVRYLGVLPSLWGSGVATALLAALPKWLSAAGFTCAVLSVYTDNQAAIASYVHAGWVPIGDATPHRDSGRLEQQYRLGSGVPQ